VELYFYETGLQELQDEQDTSHGSLITVTALIFVNPENPVILSNMKLVSLVFIALFALTAAAEDNHTKLDALPS